MLMIKKSTLIAVLLTIVMCFTAFISKAQLGYTFSQYDVGVSGSINSVNGDTQTKTSTSSVNFSFGYNQSPFVNYVFEVQAGSLAGGNEYKDSTGRQFSNSFVSFIFRGQIQAGELIDYSQSPFANAMKNFYVSTGVGMVVNHLTTNRYSYLIPGLYTPGEDNSNEIFIPARIGYEFKIFNQYGEPSVKIDLAYEYNFVLGDELDGFKVGNNNDAYSQLSLGVKFAIFSKTSYRKQISY